MNNVTTTAELAAPSLLVAANLINLANRNVAPNMVAKALIPPSASRRPRGTVSTRCVLCSVKWNFCEN